MKTKAKLAFKMLEQEIELLTKTEMQSSVGGSVYYGGSGYSGGSGYVGGSGPTDCVFQTMAYMSQRMGQNYSLEYIQFLYEQNFGSIANGVPLGNINSFLDYVFNIQVFDSCNSNGNVSSGNIFCFYNTGEIGNQHAVSLQSINQNNGTAQVYDAQAGINRTISLDSIYGSYSLSH